MKQGPAAARMIGMERILDRMRHWLDSDLVGVAVTLAAATVFGLAFLGFYVAGPVGGIAFAIFSIGLIAMIVVQPGRRK
jgi:hypothetical protein